MTDSDLHAPGCKRSIEHWQKQLDKTIYTKTQINPCALESGPFVFAASSTRLNIPLGRNWLAVGDAAVAFDPLSSQGVYKALESGIRAARAIHGHFEGDAGALHSYVGELNKSFDHYLALRNKYYGLERRWTRSTFWHRR